MKNGNHLPTRAVIGVIAGAAFLTLIPIARAGWLAPDTGVLLASAPAILMLAAIVSGLVGAIFFGSKSEQLLLVAPVPSPALPRARPAIPASAGLVYNERKIKAMLPGIPEIPAKHARKKRRPQEVAQVIESRCTGCGLCVPFCPTDCIEYQPADSSLGRALPPVRVRYDECTGCAICSRVCETFAWDATVMRPTEAIEREEGIVIHDRAESFGSNGHNRSGF